MQKIADRHGRRIDSGQCLDRKTELAHGKVGPRLFKTSFGCSQARISTNGRDTTRAEISLADDPAKCQLAAEWDLLNTPFGALPRQLPPTLASIHQYWKMLIRAENPMPFSDDVSLGPIEKLSAHLKLVDVFSGPQRFRFNRLGENIIGKLTNDLTGQFADALIELSKRSTEGWRSRSLLTPEQIAPRFRA
ncbi:MAG: hypothetical protein WB689_12570 [Xanthobacteraceae bacterium]